MRWTMIVVALLCCGCQPWTEAQMALTAQARRGIALAVKSDRERDKIEEEIVKLRRQRLDQAFDDDALAREPIDANWVIEARRAYAAALDALAEQRTANERSAEGRRRNLRSIDAALERLGQLQSIQAGLMSWEGER